MSRDQAIDFLLLFDAPSVASTTQHDALQALFEKDMGREYDSYEDEWTYQDWMVETHKRARLALRGDQ